MIPRHCIFSDRGLDFTAAWQALAALGGGEGGGFFPSPSPFCFAIKRRWEMGNASEAEENNLPFRSTLSRYTYAEMAADALFYSRYFFRESEKWSECISPLPPSMSGFACYGGGGGRERNAGMHRGRERETRLNSFLAAR